MTAVNPQVVILAAGQGTRMRSNLPKVLQPLAGMPLLKHVIQTARQLSDSIIVVYGHGGDEVRAAFSDQAISWVHQEKQKGTGHAVAIAADLLDDEKPLLVLYGDVPLVRQGTLSQLLSMPSDLSILTAMVHEPTGYGRIIRSNNGVSAIIEQADANDEQLAINEINSGILCGNTGHIKSFLAQIEDDNHQGELYLTDIVSLAVEQGKSVEALCIHDETEILGVNNKQQLAQLERIYQRNLADQLMLEGTTIIDPDRIDIRGSLKCGRDVMIDVNCIFEGEVTIGDNVIIESNNLIKDATIESGSRIKSNSVIESCEIRSSATIGPFARIRPDTTIHKNAHIGNFVEIKKSSIGQGSKVNHLTYIGDATIGSNSNIGAGTITCNYDGANKHPTVIGDNVFIGSGNELVAPIRIADNATTGAGSTLTSDVGVNNLAIARSKQRQIPGWKRPDKTTK